MERANAPVSAPVATPAPTADAPKFLKITSSDVLRDELKNNKEIMLHAYFDNNIEVVDFTDGTIKYFDRGNDETFASKLAMWLQDKTGHAWTLSRETESHHVQTAAEQNQVALESDPLVASAMDLFEGAQIVGSK